MNKPRKKHQVSCAVCGQTFLAQGSKATYCSAVCRRQAKRENVASFRQQQRKEAGVRAKPKVTLEMIGQWQVEHRRKTGQWLGYHPAVEQMRREGYPV